MGLPLKRSKPTAQSKEKSPPNAFEDSTTAKSENGSSEQSRPGKDRRARVAEIEAFTQEMLSSEPSWTPQSVKRARIDRNASDAAGQTIFAADDAELDRIRERFGVHVDMDNGEEEEEDDDTFGPSPADHDDDHPDHSDQGTAVDIFALKYQVPISHQVELGGHTKTVTCLSYAAAGNR
jgi:hypothetical protein